MKEILMVLEISSVLFSSAKMKKCMGEKGTWENNGLEAKFPWSLVTNLLISQSVIWVCGFSSMKRKESVTAD